MKIRCQNQSEDGGRHPEDAVFIYRGGGGNFSQPSFFPERCINMLTISSALICSVMYFFVMVVTVQDMRRQDWDQLSKEGLIKLVQEYQKTAIGLSICAIIWTLMALGEKFSQ